MTMIPPSFRLKVTEWLFKQSEYGGPSHIVVNVDEYMDYLRNPVWILRIETMCGKHLKYNDEYSIMRAKDGLVRNICPECVLNYESEEKAERAEERKADYRRRNADLPF